MNDAIHFECHLVGGEIRLYLKTVKGYLRKGLFGTLSFTQKRSKATGWVDYRQAILWARSKNFPV